MADLELRGVRKSFGSVEVIRGIDCMVKDGEFVVIVGPSGCGKSTLLRCIAGLEAVSEGQIFIGGRVVNDLEPKDRDIAMVFQTYALYPHMSVFSNMAYGLRQRRVPDEEIERSVGGAATMLQIRDFLRRKPAQLSGGQRQRVAMGRAIVRNPKVFLFDEPLSNLDAKLRVEMRVEIKKQQTRLQATSVFVTHDQVEAMTLADRLIVMNEGVAEQIGGPLDIYNCPATKFVASFIGSPAMNFFRARQDPTGSWFDLSGGQRLPLGDRDLASLGEHEVTLGVRAEHIRVTSDTRSDAVRFDVDHVEELGAEAIVYGRIGADQAVVRLPMQGAVKAGECVLLVVEPHHLHLFDPDTGQRVGAHVA